MRSSVAAELDVLETLLISDSEPRITLSLVVLDPTKYGTYGKTLPEAIFCSQCSFQIRLEL